MVRNNDRMLPKYPKSSYIDDKDDIKFLIFGLISRIFRKKYSPFSNGGKSLSGKSTAELTLKIENRAEVCVESNFFEEKNIETRTKIGQKKT